MHACLRSAIQLVARRVVTEIVASVVCKPQLARRWMPVEPDGVAHAAREDFLTRSVRLHAQDGGVWIAPVAHVARRADRHIQQAIWTEADELPAVVAVARKFVGDDDRRAG